MKQFWRRVNMKVVLLFSILMNITIREILFSGEMSRLSDDTVETLAQRVHALEYTYYPQVMERLLSFPS